MLWLHLMQSAHCADETIISESIHVEMGKRKSEASAEDSKKKTRQKPNKAEREAFSHSLQVINRIVLVDEATSKLKSCFSERSLNKLVESLCSNNTLMEELVEYYRGVFVRLYCENGIKKDSFLFFQFHWYQNCSALLLEEKYELTELSLN